MTDDPNPVRSGELPFSKRAKPAKNMGQDYCLNCDLTEIQIQCLKLTSPWYLL